MTRNVGPMERYARLAVAAAAGTAAMRTTGWQRATLGAVAAAGLGTGLTQYCPINQAMGRKVFDAVENASTGDLDTDLRRQTDMNAALGSAPSAGSTAPPITPDNSQFNR